MAEVTLRILLRDFETPKLADQSTVLRNVAETTDGRASPGRRSTSSVTPQYRNMAEGPDEGAAAR